MSEGLCLGCRHADNPRFSTTGHCRGNGDLEPSVGWAGFRCTCPCRPVSATTNGASSS